MPITGQKPGKGTYYCTQCAQSVTLYDNMDTLPLCPKCSNKYYRSIVSIYFDYLLEKTESQTNCDFIYRGQRSAIWELKSSAQRRLDNQNKITGKKHDFKDFIIYHKQIIENARYLGYDNNGKFSDLEMLAEVQHHGGATCLTDFSTNFLVALWFASGEVKEEELTNEVEKTLIDESDIHKNPVTKLHGRIFIVNLFNEKNFTNIYPIRKIKADDRIDSLLEKRAQFNGLKKSFEPRFWLWKPTRLNNRIVQQNSVFMFGLSKFKDNINEVSIYIHPDDKRKIRKELDTYFNLSSESVFDDLPGFSFEANSQNKPIGVNIFEDKNCIDIGKKLYKQGEYETAIKYFEMSLECKTENKCSNSDSCNLSNKSQLFFERGKCYYQLDKSRTDLQALNDFEKVIESFKESEINSDTFIAACNYKLIILCKLENFLDAYDFCVSIIENERISLNDKKEFYYSAFEIAIILENPEKSEWIKKLIKSTEPLNVGFGALLFCFFNSIEKDLQYSSFLDLIESLSKNEFKFEAQLNWNFDEIKGWILNKKDTNRLLICQKMIELQKDLINEDLLNMDKRDS